jgi:hypothetical protein
MSGRWLAWYTCGVLALTTGLSTLVSVGPGAEAGHAAWQAALAALSFVFAAVAVFWAWLPAGHWIRRSLVVRGFLFAAAFTATMLLAASFV